MMIIMRDEKEEKDCGVLKEKSWRCF